MRRIANRVRVTDDVATSLHFVSQCRLNTHSRNLLAKYKQFPCQIRAASSKGPYPKCPDRQTPANTPWLSRWVTPDKVLSFSRQRTGRRLYSRWRTGNARSSGLSVVPPCMPFNKDYMFLKFG